MRKIIDLWTAKSPNSLLGACISILLVLRYKLLEWWKFRRIVENFFYRIVENSNKKKYKFSFCHKSKFCGTITNSIHKEILYWMKKREILIMKIAQSCEVVTSLYTEKRAVQSSLHIFNKFLYCLRKFTFLFVHKAHTIVRLSSFLLSGCWKLKLTHE